MLAPRPRHDSSRSGSGRRGHRGEPISALFTEELPAIYKKIADTPVAEEVELVVSRGSEELTFTATTEERGESTSDEMEAESWGLTARGITREQALELNLPDHRGVFVAGVKQNGPAFRAGLFPGDRIVAVENEPVDDLEELRQMYRVYHDAQQEKVLLTIMRRHSRRWMLIEASYEN